MPWVMKAILSFEFDQSMHIVCLYNSKGSENVGVASSIILDFRSKRFRQKLYFISGRCLLRKYHSFVPASTPEAYPVQ